MATDNPAQVLYEVLDRARLAAENQDWPPVQVWTRVFDSSDRAQLFRKLLVIQELPQAVRATVETLGIDPQPVDRAMARVELAWLDQGHGTWRDFWAGIGGDGALDFTQMTASYIDAATAREDRFTIDNPAGLRTRIVSLRDEVATSDLPDLVKKIVTDRLTAMVEELAEIDVSTTLRFREQVQAFVGLLATTDAVYNALRKSTVGKLVLATLAGVVLFFAPSLTEGKPALELPPPEHVIIQCIDPSKVPALPPGEHPPAEDTAEDESTAPNGVAPNTPGP